MHLGLASFRKKVVEEFPNGVRHVLNEEGAIVIESPDAKGVAAEVGYTLKDRDCAYII